MRGPMTLSQFETYVRQRCNAVNDTNWGTLEIYALAYGRIQEIVSVIGLLQGSSSVTTVVGTQTYNFPTNFITLKALFYDGQMLSPISFKDAESINANGVTPSGKPINYIIWNNQVCLYPNPDAVKTLLFVGEKEHAFIDGTTQTTIDIPSVLHTRLANGVIADMADKDENWGLSDRYNKKWTQDDIPAFQRFAFLQKRRARFKDVTDADTTVSTEFGVV